MSEELKEFLETAAKLKAAQDQVERESWEATDDYVAVRIPDKMLLASILNEAKGSRTMAQLAEACNISASTLSRAVNGKITRPMTLDLIKSIAENSESENKQRLFERLIHANGYVSKEEYEEDVQVYRNFNDRYMSERQQDWNYLRNMRNVVMTELLRRGIPVRLLDYNAAPIISKYKMKINYSFQIETDLGNGKIVWSFFNIGRGFDDPDYDIPDEECPSCDRGFFLMEDKVLNNLSRWFLLDELEPEILSNRIHTILTADKKLSAYFNDFFADKKVNNDFSFVSVDIDEECVNFEAYMERKDGQEHELIFDRPVIDSENYSETWPKHKNQGGK